MRAPPGSWLGLFAAAALACSGAPAAPKPEGAAPPQPAPEAAKAEPAVPVAPQAPSEPTAFGAPIDSNVPRVALAELMRSPEAHAGKMVRTEGEIQRVCQRMGCWMELSDKDAPGALRVPMAGHSFFLPQSVRGKRASVQGTLQVGKLSAAHKEHLESEGAQATTSDVSLAATGVALK